MLKTVVMSGALLAVGVVCLLGLPVSLLLRRVRALCLPSAEAAPDTDAQKPAGAPAPLLGGLVLWVGVGFALVSAYLLADAALVAGGYTGGWRMVATLLGCALLFGLIGLLDDCVRVARHGKRLPAAARLGLQLAVAAVFLAQLALNGTLSTLVCLPGFGWVDLGWGYYVFSAVLILAIVNAMDAAAPADGLCAGVGFVAALTFLILAMLLLEMDVPGDRFVTALFGAATAGGCVGFLLWSFPPARLAAGSTVGMFLAGAMVAMAWGLGRPELLVLVGIAALCDLLAALLPADGRPLCGVPLHRRLQRSGWSGAATVGLFCGLGCLGSLLAVLAVFLYG